MPPAIVPDTTSPAALQEASVLQGIGEYELPRTTLVKLAKGSVRLCSSCRQRVYIGTEEDRWSNPRQSRTVI